MTHLAALLALETEYQIYLARCASWGSMITPYQRPEWVAARRPD